MLSQVRGRRVVSGVVLAMVLAVLAVGGAELAWARTTPLVEGSASVSAEVCPDPTSDVGCSAQPPLPGGTFEFAFSVRNAGLLPLTILGAGFTDGTPITIENLRMLPADSTVLGIGAGEAFEPFVLHSTEERTLVATGRTSVCYSMGQGGSGVSITTVTIGFRWLSLRQSHVLRLPEDLLHFPYGGGRCG